MTRHSIRLLVLLPLLAALAACGGTLALQDSRPDAPSTPDPTMLAQTPAPTDAPITEDPGGYARAFYRAWETGDYLGMYSLLAPSSQALVDSTAFVQRYAEAMDTAGIRAVATQPLAILQEGDTAEYSVRVTLASDVVGDIVRDHTTRLAYEAGRWGVVWDEGLILPELAGGNRLTLELRVPSRGNIYDINGKALAYQGNAFELGVVPGLIQDEPGLLAALSETLGLSAEDIKAKYATALPDWYVPVGVVSEEALQQHALRLEPFLGAGLTTPDRRPSRLYSESDSAAHVIGYMGPIPADQVADYKARGYLGDELIGLAGLEAWGEEYLNGVRGGILSVVDPAGEVVEVLQDREPQVARSIYTSLNLDFQAAVEQALADAIATHPAAERGAIVVLDPNNGAVRALATYPSYDPQAFDPLRGDGGAAVGALLNDPSQPLLNRATQGAYPAGSTFKIVTFTAALASGLYTPDSRYTSIGSWSRLGEAFTKYDWLSGGHGTISLRQALVVSCNTCFYDAGYTIDGADNTLLPRIAKEFGLGQPTGIQGIAESAGLIPDPEWKLTTQGEGWATGDSVNMAIGQGFVQVTPLQMANIAAAIANGGTLYQPTLIDHIGAGGDAPEERLPVVANGHIPLSAEQLAVVRSSLWDVTHAGSGTATHRFQNFPVPVAGKTGTAEAPPGLPHAWFVGYAPAEPFTAPDGRAVEGPELAIAVLLENTGEGSEAAAPLFRRVVELYYGIEPARFPWE
ncbi:penicillin-binding transpeptidase domain-containing protein [Promineifilum sp.]|uniref:penicillin-binding transpeptidase domain-containing protein n=1 Tax=Promineifilum sp. TaxID=2664178 RepID=UPI0035B3211A